METPAAQNTENLVEVAEVKPEKAKKPTLKAPTAKNIEAIEMTILDERKKKLTPHAPGRPDLTPAPARLTDAELIRVYGCACRSCRNAYEGERGAATDPFRAAQLVCRYQSYGTEGIEFWEKKDDEVKLPERFVSVEIELSRAQRDRYTQFKTAWDNVISVCAAVKTDGSVSGDGIELNTMPSKGSYFFKQMSVLTKALKDLNAEANGTCGLHVHVDCRDMETKDLFKLANVWACIQDDIQRLVAPTRASNHFCKFATKEAREIWLQKKMKLSSSKGDLVNRISSKLVANGRYAAMNIDAINAHNTVEFRCHEGSADGKEIQGWACLCSAIVQYAKTCSMAQSRKATLDKIVAKNTFVKGYLKLRTAYMKKEFKVVFPEKPAKVKKEEKKEPPLPADQAGVG